MSSEMYSTNPSLIAAVAVGAPPFLHTVAGGRFDGLLSGMGWVGLCVGVFFVSIAIWISWDVGCRGILMQCPIITGVGVAVGFIGWLRVENMPLMWATGILFVVLMGVTLYAMVTKSLH